MKNSYEDDKRIKEGFIGQKIFVVPGDILREIKRSSFLNLLYFTDVGFYPNAANHFRERNPGVEEFILIYCIEGEGWIQIGTKKYMLSANSFFIIPKATAHKYGAIKNTPWCIYWIHFSGKQSLFFINDMKRCICTRLLDFP